jgi:hypothetical protein
MVLRVERTTRLLVLERLPLPLDPRLPLRRLRRANLSHLGFRGSIHAPKDAIPVSDSQGSIQSHTCYLVATPLDTRGRLQAGGVSHRLPQSPAKAGIRITGKRNSPKFALLTQEPESNR